MSFEDNEFHNQFGIPDQEDAQQSPNKDKIEISNIFGQSIISKQVDHQQQNQEHEGHVGSLQRKEEGDRKNNSQVREENGDKIEGLQNQSGQKTKTQNPVFDQTYSKNQQQLKEDQNEQNHTDRQNNTSQRDHRTENQGQDAEQGSNLKERQEEHNVNQFEQNVNQFEHNANQQEQNANQQEQNANKGLEESFKWGEEQKIQQQNQRNFQQLFIDIRLRASEQLIKKKPKNNQIPRRVQSERIKKVTQKDDVDIWSDLRESMVKQVNYQNAQNNFRQKRQKPSLNNKEKKQEKKRSQSEKKLPISKSILEESTQKKTNVKLSGLRKSLAPMGKDQSSSKGQNEEEMLENIEKMKKQIAKKMRQWARQQKQIQRGRLESIQKKQKQIQSNQKLQKLHRKHQIEQEKQERIQKVMLRLKKRSRRKQILSKSLEKSLLSKSLSNQDSPQISSPKIVKLSKKSKEKDGQKKIKNTPLKVNKSQKLMNLKTHAKSSQLPKKQAIKLISSTIQQVPNDSRLKHVQNFNLNLKDMTQHEVQKLKLQRRVIFKQKVMKIPVNVSQESRLKMLMRIDKSMNSLKYQIMKRKGFTEEEIYHQTKEFNLPSNPKDLGKKYLKELRSKNRAASLLSINNNLTGLPKNERNWKPSPTDIPTELKQYKSSTLNPQIVRISSKIALYDEDTFLKYLQK